jgi:3-methyladenine DNA glycosylase Tag
MPEMKTPDRITPQSPGDYLEVMSKVGFQSGMPYKIVKFKWPGNRKACHEFHAAKWPA